jgi:hypothetical protein
MLCWREEGWYKTIKTFREKCVSSWDKDTAYPGSLKYNPLNSESRGQCYVTALAVMMSFGGKLVRGITHEETHYWNKFTGGIEIDLTSDQFGGNGIHPVSASEIKEVSPNFDNKRFLMLWNRIKSKY